MCVASKSGRLITCAPAALCGTNAYSTGWIRWCTLREKGNVETAAERKKSQEEKKLSSRRKAPAIRISKSKSQNKVKKRMRLRTGASDNPIRHVKFKVSTAKPKQDIIERLRQRNVLNLSHSEVRRSLIEEQCEMQDNFGTRVSIHNRLNKEDDKNKDPRSTSRTLFIKKL